MAGRTKKRRTTSEGGHAGNLLRTLREKRTITGQELARRLGTSQATISKIETGTQEPTIDYVVRFASELGLSKGETKELVARLNLLPTGIEALEVLSPVPAEFFSGDKTKRQQRAAEHLESAASVIRVFQPLCVPDLLQTEEYASEALRLSGERNPEDLERAVQGRLKRQKQLEKKTHLVFLMTEGALRARVCSSRGMIAQIARLKSVMARRNVRLGIIPFSARLTAWIPTGFSVFNASLAQVEVPHGRISLVRGSVVESYLVAFEALSRMALFGAEASSALDRIAKDFERLEVLEAKVNVPL
jgi:transcriptional regulator with XRE-family HTH domain